jgi:hypothetical protein
MTGVMQAIARYFEQTRKTRVRQDGKLRMQECTVCGNMRYCVQVDLTTGMLHCFRCGHHEHVFPFLMSELGVSSIGALRDALPQAEDIVDGDSYLAALTAYFEDTKNVERPPLDWAAWSSDFNTTEGQRVLAYARKRDLPNGFVYSGRYGYFRGDGPLTGRACFQVREDGKPVYVSARAYDGRMPKYLYPLAVGECKASSYVFNLDMHAGQPLVVCEGVISALSCPCGVAVFGKIISETQAYKIAQASPTFVIVLREQEVTDEELVLNLERLLSHGVACGWADLIDGDANDNPGQLEAVFASATVADEQALFELRLRQARALACSTSALRGKGATRVNESNQKNGGRRK